MKILDLGLSLYMIVGEVQPFIEVLYTRQKGHHDVEMFVYETTVNSYYSIGPKESWHLLLLCAYLGVILTAENLRRYVS